MDGIVVSTVLEDGDSQVPEQDDSDVDPQR